MVLLGLSVLLLSVSYCFYRFPPALFSLTCARLHGFRKQTRDITPSIVVLEEKALAVPRKVEGIPQHRNLGEELLLEDEEDEDGDKTPVQSPVLRPALCIAESGPPIYSMTSPTIDLSPTKNTSTIAMLSPRPSLPASELMPPPPPRPPNRPSIPASPSTTAVTSTHTSSADSSPRALHRSSASSSPKNNASNTLRVPTTGPLPNRGPPNRNSAATSSSNLLLPTSSTLPPSTRSRRPVTLKPGHSPLDWADLTRTHPNLNGLPSARLLQISPTQVSSHNGRSKNPDGSKRHAWSVYQGKVYNVTPYLDFHPGGKGELMRGVGNLEGEKLFQENHPWVNWDGMLSGCLVGMLVGEGEGDGEIRGRKIESAANTAVSEELEEMD